MNACPVLTYHAVEDVRAPIAVSPARFASTMRAMKAAGWRTATLEELLAGLPNGRWQDKTFALHFDDGFASVLEYAWPVLVEVGFTATVFVVASWVGRTNDWESQPQHVPRWPLMDWQGLTRLVDSGWSIGAHTCSHPRLTDLSVAQQERELAEGAMTIADRLGVTPRSFAYPYGIRAPGSAELVARYHRAAFGTRLSFVRASSRVMDLERIDAYYLTPALAAALDSPRAHAYIRARHALRVVRQIIG